MDAVKAFTRFVNRALVSSKAERFATLVSSEKGQRKVLDALCHQFEDAVLDFATRSRDFSSIQNRPCFAFHTSCGFGASFATIADAYDTLSMDDGWLILDTNGSVGIYRPEARWDDEMIITA